MLEIITENIVPIGMTEICLKYKYPNMNIFEPRKTSSSFYNRYISKFIRVEGVNSFKY